VLAEALRAAPEASFTAAHAYDVPFEGMLHRSGVGSAQIDQHRAEALRSAFARIEDMARALAPPGRILALAERGHPARLLLDRAAALDADLIVLGRRRRSAAERFFVGSVARHVAAGTASDVLVVAQPQA
jgi:nucleotide-binding universal stress UspA family protein